MKWFPGPYQLATQVSKKNGALLVVFVESSDEKGTLMTSLWEQIEQSVFTCPVVAVHLKNGEPATEQFTKSFPTPILPASYFIDNEGKLIEIVTVLEDLDFNTFSAKIVSIVENFTKSKAVTAPQTSVSSESASQTPLSLDEKVKRAKDLLEKKKLDEEERKKAEEKEKEMDRIRSGKLMQEAAQRRQDQELIEAAAQRRREKLQAEADKERVKAQIKADREEREYRQKRAAGVQGNVEQKQSPVEHRPPVRVESDRCRILIRFSDHDPICLNFPATDTLNTLADVLVEENHANGAFSLVQPFPRKVFSAAEMRQSFIDLCLTPSCTLVVEQKRSATSAVLPAGGLYALLSLIILTPFQYVWNILQSFLGGGGNTNTTTAKREDPAASNAAGDDVRPRGIPTAATIRRRGNIAGLHNTNGDERDPEDNANWNGNSTQFM